MVAKLDATAGMERAFFRKSCERIPVYYIRVLCVAAGCYIGLSYIRLAAAVRSSDTPLTVSWRLLDNLPDNHFKCELTVGCTASAPLRNRWVLYFNCPSKLELDPVSSQFELAHINGDFYSLSPSKNYDPIASGDSRTVLLLGAPWAINVSDAPSGFYLVQHEREARVGQPVPIPIRIEDFPPATKLHRGSADVVPVVTPESRYRANERLTKLSADQIGKVVPTPMETTVGAGRFAIRSSSTIRFSQSLSKEAELLASALNPLLSACPLLEQDDLQATRPSMSIRLRTGAVTLAGQAKKNGDEAYTLAINPEHGIEIVGSDPAGVFYGIQTLLALVPIESYRQKNTELLIDATTIADAPRFRYRGVHLDVARNFQSKRTVKKLIELMAFYKLNRLHLHLTDDEGWRIEVKGLPELTSVGAHRGHTLNESECLVPSHGSGPFAEDEKSPGNGFYSQNDFVEILQFAQMRRIEVIPELDFPGHARAAIKSMEARSRHLLGAGKSEPDTCLLREPGDQSQYESVQMWRDNVVDVGRESTYRFLKLVVVELTGIYKRAGVPLVSIHLGGDEVPKGAWQKSKACEQIALAPNTTIARGGQLELYFLNRASEILLHHSIQPACWEDCPLLELGENAAQAEYRKLQEGRSPTVYVWNNVWGWGREDAAYRLANAGFDVVLCNATNLYFDLAYEKDPDEIGYYWAGFVATRAPFELVPLDVFKNAERNGMGQPISPETLANRAQLTRNGEKHILGIQGQLWGENLRSPERLESMAFPRLICLAERAWARSPPSADISDRDARARVVAREWNEFANRLGQRELPRLDHIAGGVHYHLPSPGAMISNGRLYVNVAFPGLDVRYTTDGSEPNESSSLCASWIPYSAKTKLRSFGANNHGSMATSVPSNLH